VIEEVDAVQIVAAGETYREMLKRMAEESGIETPSADDLVRLDRSRKDKKLSNADWVSRTDPDAKIAKMKDGTTHLAYKPEHAVDLDTGAVVAAENTRAFTSALRAKMGSNKESRLGILPSRKYLQPCKK
jgi:hypothetical protein